MFKSIGLICFLLLLNTSEIFSQSKKWVQVKSPIFSDLHSLFMFSPDSGVIGGKHVLYLSDNNWTRMKIQPKSDVNSLFALNSDAIFISYITEYQESDLYYWDGNYWKEIFQPLVNTIYSMYFIDDKNGVIGGFGEIAICKNNKWSFLPPPVHGIINSLQIDNDSIIWALSKNVGLFKYVDKWEKIENSNNVQLLKQFNENIYILGSDYFGKIQSDSILVLSKDKRLVNIKSFDVINDDEIIGVGRDGLILKYFDGKWSQEQSPVVGDINEIVMTKSDRGYIVGNDGTILKYTNKKNERIYFKLWRGFEEKTYKSYAKSVDDEYGVVAADFNNDGLVDFFTCGLFESNNLYINQDNNSFIEEGEKWGLKSLTNTNVNELNLGACAADIDNDGDFDLYVTTLNGENKIYKNINNERFVDYSQNTKGVGGNEDRTNCSIFGDVDNDGDLDLFITNETSSNRLYLNNSAGIFKEVTKSVGLNTTEGGMNASFGDIDNDGDLDLYVANWSDRNILYKNLIIEKGILEFENISFKSGVEGYNYTKSNAVVFSDIDNDADLDLFVTNRKLPNRLYINNGLGVFTDKTNELIGKDSFKTNGAIIADFDGDGLKDIYLSNVGENVLFKNEGGQFINQKSIYGSEINGYSTGCSVADIGNDGDLDIYVANYIGESSTILINKLNNDHYIKLRINIFEDNRNGIGTKISTFKDGGLGNKTQLIDFRQITAGSGYSSMNEIPQTIQIQDNEFVDIEFHFPSGLKKSLSHVEKGSHHVISDVTRFRRYYIITKQWMLRNFLDPHKLFNLLKWFGILLIIIFSSIHGFKKYKWSKLFLISFAIFLICVYYLQFHYFEYERVLFSTILPISSIIGIALLIHLYFERQYVKQIAIKDKDQIREKLSRDLHDDLASTISSIGIYLTLIRYNIKKENSKVFELLGKSESLVSNASSSITDLIWAIKPKPESLNNLISRINNNFEEMFIAKGIEYKIINFLSKDTILLKPKIKQNVYLIIKEALNNILKYANAKNVILKLEKNSLNKILIVIEDDGIGYDSTKVKNKGHGLLNMRKRADEMGGEFFIKSVIGEGTKCDLIFKFN